MALVGDGLIGLLYLAGFILIVPFFRRASGRSSRGRCMPWVHRITRYVVKGSQFLSSMTAFGRTQPLSIPKPSVARGSRSYWIRLFALAAALLSACQHMDKHMDSGYRAEVLESVQDISYRNEPELIVEIFKAAIEEWDDPSQAADRLRACEDLFVWYWAAPNTYVRDADFDNCPAGWRSDTLDSEFSGLPIESNSELQSKMLKICSALFENLAIERQSVALERIFRNCPATWRDSQFGPQPDGDYRSRFLVVPINPWAAIRDCREGWVEVRFDILPDGTTTNVVAAESSNKVFEEPTLKAIEKSLFWPARRNGEAHRSNDARMTVKFQFEESTCRNPRVY